MKTALLVLLVAVTSATANDLSKPFETQEPRELERPYVGELHRYYPAPTDDKSKPEAVKLNQLHPPSTGGALSINTPFLAEGSGESFTRPFALRSSMPAEKEIAGVKSYAEVLKLLGEPTTPAIFGETLDGWALDQVGWRVFKPLTQHSIKAMYVTVNRRYRSGAKPEEVVMESLSVSSGIVATEGR